MPAVCFCSARIHDPQWRVDLWTRVFGKPEAPVVQPFPVESADFPDGRARFVRLDVKRCSPEQLQQIAEAVAQRFGLSITDVYDDAQRHGWPVKCDENVILTGCPVHVLGAVV